jgi:hypothetical protein
MDEFDHFEEKFTKVIQIFSSRRSDPDSGAGNIIRHPDHNTAELITNSAGNPAIS